MKLGEDKDPASRLALVLLRSLKGWDQEELARASRTAPSQISIYERGVRVVPRDVLERVAAAANFPADLLDSLLWLLRSFVVSARGRSRTGRALADGAAAEVIALVREVEDLVLGRF